jgi:flavin reductase (DIM6/NTAB) family NADH-FMN oxidoreductase RutF
MLKKPLPVDQIRRFLEPGPIVLVSSAHRGSRNIMTMGWHMVMEFQPSLIGCYIWSANHSFELIRKSRECVINIPTAALASKVVDIGNTSGRDVDKFKEFGLTAEKGVSVKAPLIAECFANYECKLIDTSLIRKYSLFVFEVVAARVAAAPKYPKTIHYRGDGIFMLSGTNTARYRSRFRPEML